MGQLILRAQARVVAGYNSGVSAVRMEMTGP